MSANKKFKDLVYITNEDLEGFYGKIVPKGTTIYLNNRHVEGTYHSGHWHYLCNFDTQENALAHDIPEGNIRLSIWYTQGNFEKDITPIKKPDKPSFTEEGYFVLNQKGTSLLKRINLFEQLANSFNIQLSEMSTDMIRNEEFSIAQDLVVLVDGFEPSLVKLTKKQIADTIIPDNYLEWEHEFNEYLDRVMTHFKPYKEPKNKI